MKSVLLMTLISMSLLSNAQFVKGDKFLGGTFNFSTQRAPNSPNGGLTNVVNSFSINPQMGFLINEKVAIGGLIGYSSTYSKSGSFQSLQFESTSRDVHAGVFINRYFKMTDKFLFSLGGIFQVRRGNSTLMVTSSPDPASESNNANYQLLISLQPKFIYFPTPHWGFEASVGSISDTYNRSLSTGDKSNVFGFNYGSIGVGVNYYFRKAGK
jgi:hypothetical protein